MFVIDILKHTGLTRADHHICLFPSVFSFYAYISCFPSLDDFRTDEDLADLPEGDVITTPPEREIPLFRNQVSSILSYELRDFYRVLQSCFYYRDNRIIH